jgi:hypothetical protein
MKEHVAWISYCRCEQACGFGYQTGRLGKDSYDHVASHSRSVRLGTRSRRTYRVLFPIQVVEGNAGPIIDRRIRSVDRSSPLGEDCGVVDQRLLEDRSRF